MRFLAFSIAEPVRHKRGEILHMLHEIDPEMRETDPDKAAVTVSSCREAVESYGSSRFVISDRALKEILEMQIPEFPFTSERRQIASLCLAPLWISCVGFDQATVITMARQVSLLGGVFTRGMSSDVTLVIASTNASSKVFDARRRRIPVVKKVWLEKCVESFSRVALDGFHLPKFQGLVVCSSDLAPEEHRESKRLVVNGGGVWKDVFDSEVTLLLADCLASTKKIDLALEYSVPIVRRDVLKDQSTFDVLNWWCMSDRKSRLFDGIVFSVHRECKNIETLRHVIQVHSGIVGRDPNYSLMPHGKENPFENAIAVTPFWFWRCVEAKALLPSDSSIMYSPLTYSGPISGVVGKVFYVDAIDPVLRHSLGDMIRFAGGTVIYRATANIAYAVGCEMTKPLIKIAMESKVPVVKPTFIYDMIRAGKPPNPLDYGLDNSVKTRMLKQLCNVITKSKVKNEESVPVVVERCDLESFTQEFTATQGDVMTIEVKYDSQNPCSVRDDSDDPLINAMI